jgi:thiamine-monophosphate kinase
MGEDELIARLVGLVPTGKSEEGPGDDCAVVDDGGMDLVLLKTDGLVEGVHFVRDADARRVGWKAVARVISDFAAMGGTPQRFLVTLALPASMSLDWVENFYRGMGKCFDRYGAVLVGGETCRVPVGSAAVISIAATGRVERGNVIMRSGGNVGDAIWVTGVLGGSLAGKHLDFIPRLDQARWLVKHFKPTAMMDLSDGIARDLPRLAKASSCGFQLDLPAMPLSEGCDVKQALEDGEDFELLFTYPEGQGLEHEWQRKFPALKLTKIGRLVKLGEGDELKGGWDHFGLMDQGGLLRRMFL